MSYTRSLSHISTVLCHRGSEQKQAKPRPREMIRKRNGHSYMSEIPEIISCLVLRFLNN